MLHIVFDFMIQNKIDGTDRYLKGRTIPKNPNLYPKLLTYSSLSIFDQESKF